MFPNCSPPPIAVPELPVLNCPTRTLSDSDFFSSACSSHSAMLPCPPDGKLEVTVTWWLFVSAISRSHLHKLTLLTDETWDIIPLPPTSSHPSRTSSIPPNLHLRFIFRLRHIQLYHRLQCRFPIPSSLHLHRPHLHNLRRMERR